MGLVGPALFGGPWSGRARRRCAASAGRLLVVIALAVTVLAASVASPSPASAGGENTDGKIVFVSWLQVHTMDLDGSDAVPILGQDGADFGSGPLPTRKD